MHEITELAHGNARLIQCLQGYFISCWGNVGLEGTNTQAQYLRYDVGEVYVLNAFAGHRGDAAHADLVPLEPARAIASRSRDIKHQCDSEGTSITRSTETKRVRNLPIHYGEHHVLRAVTVHQAARHHPAHLRPVLALQIKFVHIQLNHINRR